MRRWQRRRKNNMQEKIYSWFQYHFTPIVYFTLCAGFYVYFEVDGLLGFICGLPSIILLVHVLNRWDDLEEWLAEEETYND